MATFKKACYDCHSNKSAYPWYWNIQPVAWFMSNHIDEGKHHLNFSEFALSAIRRQYKTIEEIGDEVEHGDMPLTSYTLIHKEAALEDAEKQAVIGWSRSAMHSIEDKYPPDSLKKH